MTDRIQKELFYFESNSKIKGFKLIKGRHSHELEGIIPGPIGSPYEGGFFSLLIQLPIDYPYRPPTGAKFITKIWHPNVCSVTGDMCLDIEKGDWTTDCSVYTVMLSIQALLAVPVLSEPRDDEVASMYYRDYMLFERTASYWARKYASAMDKDEEMFDGKVETIVEMGFSEERAVKLLSKNDWNIEKATEEVLSNESN